MIESWRLEYRVKPITLNQQRRMHHFALAKHVNEWKSAFALLAKEAHIPPCEHITLSVRTLVKGKRTLPDPDACAPAVKMALDGLVLAAVVPDDTARYVGPICYFEPLRGDRDALDVIVVAEDAWQWPGDAPAN